jgi:hypothetical protein
MMFTVKIAIFAVGVLTFSQRCFIKALRSRQIASLSNHFHMRSHIITLTSIVCFTATSTTALAQEVEEKKETTNAPKLVVGANLGLASGAFNPTFLSDRYFKGSGGLFARYYFSKHMAVEGGLNYGLEVSKTNNYTFIKDGTTYQTNIIQRFSTYSVPVQLQYHLLSPESKIRPYFGIGGGIMRRDFFTNVNGNLEDIGKYRNSRTSGFASFTQGVTWQLNKKWQINESITIGKELRDGIKSTDFRIGVGYSLFNK